MNALSFNKKKILSVTFDIDCLGSYKLLGLVKFQVNLLGAMDRADAWLVFHCTDD